MISELNTTLYPLVAKFNEYLSNYILVFMLIGVGLWYTIQTKCIQVRCFKEGIKKVFGEVKFFGKKEDSGMSSFQALSTAIAAQVGTGSIVGASGAILVGGPGSIFWMWIIAFLGMATIYAEATLAVKTRITGENGEIKGGPVYYILTAFKGKFGKFLAVFFAIATIFAMGFMGTMVQANSIAWCIGNAFHIPNIAVGIFLVIVCGIIFSGGIKRLAAVTEKIVPIMAVFFLIGGLIILISRIQHIPEAFYLIFKYAFQPQAIIGGGFGYAIKEAVSQGAKRGLFSNEAGMGSTPHAHALANVKEPHEQGIVAMIGVFVDTYIIFTMNALVVIATLYTSDGILANGYKGALVEVINKTNLVQTAFGTIFGDKIGAMFVAICLFFFAFSTILSWNLFGKINNNYLFEKKYKKRSLAVYIIIALYFIFVGCLVSSDLVWELTDMFNNLMVMPNVIALFALTTLVKGMLPKKE